MDRPFILVVEDNPYNLELVQFLLEDSGFEVGSAQEAEELRQVLASRTPDLVLMDMQLPGTDGLTLVQELRAGDQLEEVPIVALTAHALRGDRERFINQGCDGYLAKPIDVATFAEEVRALLERGRYRMGSPGAAETAEDSATEGQD